MTSVPDRLYELLPVIHRQRDAERGYPLRALLRVIGEQVDLVEADIAQLYANWFIETCEDWVVPYIGDLIGYRPVSAAGAPGDLRSAAGQQRNKILLPRREIANTIAYRQRKGTLALLEELAFAVAGWPARAVECYTLLARTQALRHLRPDPLPGGSASLRATYPQHSLNADLRQGSVLERLNTPFDTLAHSVDVRRINSQHAPGYFNIPSVGLFVWRLRAYSVTHTAAYCLEEVGPHCYTFSVLSNDVQLYVNPKPESEPTHIAGELNLPVPITRRAFEARKEDYYGPDKSLYIWEGVARGGPGQKRVIERQPIAIERIIVADLSDWQYRPRAGFVAVDPERGRIAFPPRQLPKEGVWVMYHYGFSADIGGGEYERPIPQRDPLAIALFRADHFRDLGMLARQIRDDARPIDVYLRDNFAPATIALLDAYSGEGAPSAELQDALLHELNIQVQSDALYSNERFAGINLPEEAQRLINNEAQGQARIRLNRLLFESAYPAALLASYSFYRVGEGESIAAAISQWQNDERMPRYTIIEIDASSVFVEKIDIALKPGQSLQLRAANGKRPVIRLLNWQTDRPDSLNISGATGSRVTLDGLLVTGRGVAINGDLAAVTIRHCTLVPGWGLHNDCEPRRPAEPSLELYDVRGQVTVSHSIIGSIQVNNDEVRSDPLPISVTDSILDATGNEREAVGAPGHAVAHARLTIQRSTVIGLVQTHAIDLAENSIFTGRIIVARRQLGCMRFCAYIPGSRTPRRYNCQPDLAEQAAVEALRATTPNPSQSALAIAQQQARSQVYPQFNSTRYGTATYCQLANSCDPAISRGADDESEMGVFHDLYQPQRAANLRARLAEYTPAGMDAGLIFAS